MIQKISLLTLLLLGMAIKEGHAQSEIDLSQIWESTTRNHPLLLAAKQEQSAAVHELLSAQGAFDLSWKSRATAVPQSYYSQVRLDTSLEQPTPWWGTTFFTGWRLGAGNIADYDGKQATNSLGEIRAGVRVPLWRNGPIDRQRANLARQEISIALAQWNTLQQKLDLLRQASRSYWDWLAATRRYAVYEQLLKLAQQRDQDLSESVRLGQIPAFERLENQRAIFQRQAQLVNAERQRQQTAIDLSMFWRTAQGIPAIPASENAPEHWPELPKPNYPKGQIDIKHIWQQRPEIQRLQLQIQQLEVETSLMRNQLEPGVDLAFSFSQDLGSGSPTRSPLEIEASLNVDIPLQTRSNQGRLNSLSANIQRVAQQTQFAQERILAEVQDIQSQMATAYARLAISIQEVNWAKQIETSERDRFALGDSSLLILNLREQATADATIREIESRSDCLKSLALYAIATGNPENGWLQILKASQME